MKNNYVVLTDKQILKLSKTVAKAFSAIEAVEKSLVEMSTGQPAPKKERKPRVKKAEEVEQPTPKVSKLLTRKTNGQSTALPVLPQ